MATNENRHPSSLVDLPVLTDDAQVRLGAIIGRIVVAQALSEIAAIEHVGQTSPPPSNDNHSAVGRENE